MTSDAHFLHLTGVQSKRTFLINVSAIQFVRKDIAEDATLVCTETEDFMVQESVEEIESFLNGLSAEVIQ